MGREDFESVGRGIVKRKTKRVLGLFIDGVGLDRATRRLDRKIDLGRLVSGITTGLKVEVARYYTLIPNEDDARQFAFLDAVEKAGLEVVVKRLPPKGVNKMVSVDPHISVDLATFAYGRFEKHAVAPVAETVATAEGEEAKAEEPKVIIPAKSANLTRSAIIVCPSKELSYAIFTAHELGVETSMADFGQYGNSDGWRGVDRWIDLSTSETIWR
jgi:hypothetical protein